MVEQAKNTCVSLIQTSEESARQMIGQTSFMAAFYQDAVHVSDPEVNGWIDGMIDYASNVVNGDGEELGILKEAKERASSLIEKVQTSSNEMIDGVI